jgi:cysteine-rich repeat protein
MSIFGATIAGVCQDGILDSDEECDDGNRYSRDGCDRLCRIENPLEDVWLCTTVLGAKSECCPTLLHPVSGVKTCTCAGIAQPALSDGFSVTDNCQKRDIDECNGGGGLCHEKARCINHDATDVQGLLFTCECPTGWNGDGYTTCDINTYETNFRLVDFNVVSVDSNVVIQQLRDSVVIPASVDLEDISTTSELYFGGSPVISRRFAPTDTGDL